MIPATGTRIRYNWLISIFTIQALVKCLSVFLILSLLFFTSTAKYVENKDFDYLIFSQRWLPTACVEYEEKSPGSSHYCTLPKNYKFWAIHGLWPNKNHEFGPFFCNNSMPFDKSVLAPIESELETYWPNIEGGKTVSSLWEHEWKKHGTCAAQLPLLDSEIKYFNTTLTAFKTLKLENTLIMNGILPSSNGIDISNVFHLIKNTLGKNPHINCIFEAKTHQPYISEIRLCYNKNLELIDCEIVKSRKFKSNFNLTNVFTNCPLDHNVMYPSSIDPQTDSSSIGSSRKGSFYDLLIDTLHIIRFLQWASL